MARSQGQPQRPRLGCRCEGEPPKVIHGDTKWPLTTHPVGLRRPSCPTPRKSAREVAECQVAAVCPGEGSGWSQGARCVSRAPPTGQNWSLQITGRSGEGPAEHRKPYSAGGSATGPQTDAHRTDKPCARGRPRRSCQGPALLCHRDASENRVLDGDRLPAEPEQPPHQAGRLLQGLLRGRTAGWGPGRSAWEPPGGLTVGKPGRGGDTGCRDTWTATTAGHDTERKPSIPRSPPNSLKTKKRKP